MLHRANRYLHFAFDKPPTPEEEENSAAAAAAARFIKWSTSNFMRPNQNINKYKKVHGSTLKVKQTLVFIVGTIFIEDEKNSVQVLTQRRLTLVVCFISVRVLR